MTQFMLMFSLGPVQPFILQARKTRDLWSGSLLLSMLMQAGLSNIEGELVFPATHPVNNIPDIPNKYVALFNTQDDALAATKKSTDQIRDEWNRICRMVRDKVINQHADPTTTAIWERQTNFERLFEIYWAIVRREEGQARYDYGMWLGETESLLAARKRLRDFLPSNEPGEKSAISGEREVLRRGQANPESVRDFWKQIASEQSPNDIKREGKERLDSIDTVKRFAMNVQAFSTNKPFPSTSSIAAASFVEMLLDSSSLRKQLEGWDEATQDLIAQLQEAKQNIPYLAPKAQTGQQWLLQRDGDLYFPATFTPRYLEENYAITRAGQTIRHGKEALAKLLKASDKLHITRPTPYYAVLQMDGDRLGILLNGTREQKEHQAISLALSIFARETAPDIIEQQYPARLVYAGGDDVLAFAPLARDASSTNAGQPLHVLALADELQENYCLRVKDSFAEADQTRAGRVTASIGIAIAHHHTSLSYVLRSARAAEDAAKNQYNRNALVVTILRHSGEQTRVGCQWRYASLGGDEQPIKIFSRFLQLFKEDALSPKCVYILLEEAVVLVGLEEKAQESEVRRVLLRQSDFTKNVSEQEIATLAALLVKLAQAMDQQEDAEGPIEKKSLAVELHSDKRRHGIVEVLGWLLVMAFLARKDQEQE